MATVGEPGFRIVESRGGGAARTFVSPDVAVCDDCLAELFDPGDRRYRYPFINCTNCGPRFTITVRLPYDRPNTTMARLRPVPRLRRRVRRPGRPPLPRPAGRLRRPAGRGSGSSRPPAAGRRHRRGPRRPPRRRSAGGEIVAVKGLGGYHLACDATVDAAVDELRRRKDRADKPFAVMVARPGRGRGGWPTSTPREARPADQPAAADRAAAPAPGRRRWRRSVAPGNPYVGVLLPYTPLHHLLFRAGPGRGRAASRACW